MNRADIIAALHARRSVRGFLDTPVPRETVAAILADAARSPSASNTQPWRVHACAGAVRDRLSDALLALHDSGGDGHCEEYVYYPPAWREPYLARRRTLGKALYGLLGIPRGDAAGMARQYARNYAFFGAPVGLFFTIERRHGQAAWLDLGMFLHAVMMAALGHGVETCAQQAFARYHRVIRAQLAIPDSEIVVCGMSLGYADPAEPANGLRTTREPVEAFARFAGW
ncbi:nitroreductase [Cupriavidus consociatus]|uniref:nitroreductase n=1 Tax=Cupriavidus consociatus TaxID=2821357 RepID=UPI001AE1661C|nr:MULTISPECIES: nitroreductase [unclassified Cupriavidus]MBP0619167.1 nitroreductase [Cupriavidus sp. LEh25]MDK2655813.1 nitroreductase [Cupriavidus sp. LEh21]